MKIERIKVKDLNDYERRFYHLVWTHTAIRLGIHKHEFEIERNLVLYRDKVWINKGKDKVDAISNMAKQNAKRAMKWRKSLRTVRKDMWEIIKFEMKHGY